MGFSQSFKNINPISVCCICHKIFKADFYIMLSVIEDILNIFSNLQSREYITLRQLNTNLPNYFLMVSNEVV